MTRLLAALTAIAVFVLITGCGSTAIPSRAGASSAKPSPQTSKEIREGS
jgi:hypothetical protein